VNQTGQPLTWRRSSRCDTGQCVEVAGSGSAVLMRDSKHPDGPVLVFSAEEWNAFVAGVRQGEYDLRQP
jgi:predicted secreted Zn-dependent protease